jgi:hypothetical protein
MLDVALDLQFSANSLVISPSPSRARLARRPRLGD